MRGKPWVKEPDTTAFKQEAVNQVVVGQTDSLLNKTTFS